ncbi:hypothetical protein HU200_050344 [Digitaria exilis]|uniref:glutathione transferase n=1 Tax=Digitaria exilis TaxID=1010633 RepID=A0A835AV21_9POAL|nr:hypothetical protein HU200_050344 [Digitaria exilis]
MAAAGDGEDGKLMVLGAWPSPFVNRVRMALHLKGLEYENVEEDLANKSDLLLASNPVHKKVPVLLHGGRPVSESLIILDYLDDAFPGSGQAVLPADPYECAVARFWAAYVDSKVHLFKELTIVIDGIGGSTVIFWTRGTVCVQLHAAMLGALIGPTEEERAAATAETLAALDTLEGGLAERSGGKGFFAWDAPGYLDVVLGGFIGWLRAWDKITGLTLLDAGRIPQLVAWAQRVAALDAAKGVIPEPEHIAEFAKVLQARAAAAAAASN